MEQIGVPQIHIVPFDLGIVFYDVLTIDNTKNICFAELFCKELETKVKQYQWKLTRLFEVVGEKDRRTLLKIKFAYSDFADQVICKVELRDNLFCYVLSSGVCVFFFADLLCDAMKNTNEKISLYSKALIANYQKKLTQSTILNKASFSDVCPDTKKIMLQFREICWDIVYDGVKHKRIDHLREYSGNRKYKSDGLSYVLTMYLFERGEISDKEMKHLLCSSMFAKIIDPNKWELIDNDIKNSEPKESPLILDCGSVTVYSSWSAVAVVTNKKITKLDDLRDNEILTHLLKVEAYVQSRWFIADNSMDNVNKNSTATMESLQRTASLMEFYQAELDNEISANMNTLQKNLLKQIVETSSVKHLYKSVLTQIKMQLTIKEAHYQDKKSKNRLIADLFLAVFSASSLYKTILDLATGSFGWWNWVLFIAMMFVAVGTIVFNYKNR